ncbi:MAG TPA: LptF/LptG family permease [Gemmatimonadaceae bacterium]
MKIIGKYVLKEHVGPFLFASSALTSLMLLQYVAKRFGDLVGKGLPASVIAEFVGLSIPFTVAMTLPMAVLVAVLYAFSRLASENEITAMKASGVSMWSLLFPVLGGGLALSLIMLAFNDQVLPRSNHRLAVLQLDIFRTKPTFALREQVINAVKEGQLYLRAAHIDERTSEMKDVVIYDLGDPAHRRTIYADSGLLALAPNRRDLDMTLFHGSMHELPNNKPGQMSRMFYRRNRLRVKNVLNSYQESENQNVSKGNREMSVCEMQRMMSRAYLNMRMAEFDSLQTLHEQLGAPKPAVPEFRQAPGLGALYCAALAALSVKEAEASAPPAQAPLAYKTVPPAAGSANTQVPTTGAPAQAQVDPIALRKLAPLLQEARVRWEDARRDRNSYDVEIQKKFSLAASCLIFVLIGAPIALRFPRGGVGLVIGVSFAIFGVYYVGLIGGESLANAGYLRPWIAMWGANIILTGAGTVLAFRMGRESATTRGSNIQEWWMAVRDWILQRRQTA